MYHRLPLEWNCNPPDSVSGLKSVIPITLELQMLISRHLQSSFVCIEFEIRHLIVSITYVNKNRTVYSKIVFVSDFLSKSPHKKSIFLIPENKNTPNLQLNSVSRELWFTNRYT